MQWDRVTALLCDVSDVTRGRSPLEMEISALVLCWLKDDYMQPVC